MRRSHKQVFKKWQKTRTLEGRKRQMREERGVADDGGTKMSEEGREGNVGERWRRKVVWELP